MKPFNPESEPAAPEYEHLPSHLKEGVPAIMACVGTLEQFRQNPGPEKFAFKDKVWGISGVQDVNYYANPRDLERENFKNHGRDSYVISPIDNLDKLSKSFFNCTGVVVAGYDKTTGENISFLSHEDPDYFLNRESNWNGFVSDLRERLAELKEKCAEGTIDAAIVGGNYFHGTIRRDADYLESIRLLATETEKVLGFEPIVITGPKVARGSEDVFYENKTRRLYISRPEIGNGSSESFKPSELGDQERKW